MKATVTYKEDDTTHELVIEGERISSQLWDSGRAWVIVHDKGRKVRAVGFRRVSLIDVEYPHEEVA